MKHLPLFLAALLVSLAGVLLVTRDRRDADDPQAPARYLRPAVAPSSIAKAPPPYVDAVEIAPPTDSPRTRRRTVDLSQEFAQLHVEDASLAEALDDVGRRLGCDVSHSAGAWEVVEAASVHLQLADVSAATILDLLTEPYGLAYRVHEGSLWILLPGEEPPETGR